MLLPQEDLSLHCRRDEFYKFDVCLFILEYGSEMGRQLPPIRLTCVVNGSILVCVCSPEQLYQIFSIAHISYTFTQLLQVEAPVTIVVNAFEYLLQVSHVFGGKMNSDRSQRSLL